MKPVIGRCVDNTNWMVTDVCESSGTIKLQHRSETAWRRTVTKKDHVIIRDKDRNPLYITKGCKSGKIHLKITYQKRLKKRRTSGGKPSRRGNRNPWGGPKGKKTRSCRS